MLTDILKNRMDARIIANPLKNTKIPYESAGKLLFDRLSSFPQNFPALVSKIP